MQLTVGDPVIYRKPKSSPHPGPRAKQVYALEKGESYHYVVDKFWKVLDVKDDGMLELVTRTGKKHRVEPDDPKLVKPNPLHYLLFRKRFPDLEVVTEADTKEA
ncbi:hypothetical protein INT08_04355 [Prosthecochloris sp. N3]|uniref:Uncharacterized protein n=1 Tax=Prosthecochloris ethylica TaxID=2743976 RepID=A0ABR9XQY8_9CHLB|nr:MULTISPECIES: hypothetical protein [Prosthecochloris]MBF0586372.1 hypothetical protein [Prosthecochloris ethylica]MBF0636410.1 hypothetical protein [Prosthecochloris ethylica]NUK47584.1 hypothetical protein [Prosthecochloris ethylica]RNA64168.1 hypothetical protein CR163_002220 [Prosthecochloris sp. ZM_2]